MKEHKKRSNGQDGFVLIASLLILLVLTVMGLAVNRNTTTEWQIARNDRLSKATFYSADAATELASEVLEQSIACLGFSPAKDGEGMTILGTEVVELDGRSVRYDLFIDGDSLGFWRNYMATGNKTPLPDDDSRDMVFPAVADGGVLDVDSTNKQPHANINFGGNTQLKEGSAIQMAAGYEGLGKGASGGGVVLLYNINVQQVHPSSSSASNICVQYGHSLGSEGDCYYK